MNSRLKIARALLAARGSVSSRQALLAARAANSAPVAPLRTASSSFPTLASRTEDLLPPAARVLSVS
jgi:hypothetical protein